jgi:hypothetical protein
MPSDVVALAARAASKLEYTTLDLEIDIVENDEQIAAVYGTERFSTALDTMVFQCKTCSYWKRQRENATPNAAQWQCQECYSEGD